MESKKLESNRCNNSIRSEASGFSQDDQIFLTLNNDQNYSLPCIPICYIILGMLCFGSFTSSVSRTLMSSVVIVMAPQRINYTSSTLEATFDDKSIINRTTMVPNYYSFSSTHYHLFYHSSSAKSFLTNLQPPSDIKLAIPWLYYIPRQLYQHFYLTSSSQSICSFNSKLSLGEMNSALKKMNRPEFDWSEQRQNLVVGAYAFGYFLALLPCSHISEYYGGRRLATVGGIGHVIFNFASPWAARFNYWSLVGCRVAIGVSHATQVPSFYYMLTRWIPDSEKSKAVAMLNVGSSLGTIFLNLISGWLCQNIGWPIVFYLTGVVNLFWLLVWAWFAHDFIFKIDYIYMHTKSADRLRTSIDNNNNNNGANSVQYHQYRQVPPINIQIWMRIFTTQSVLAIIYSKLSISWMLNMIQSKLPSYITTVLNMDLEQVMLMYEKMKKQQKRLFV